MHDICFHAYPKDLHNHLYTDVTMYLYTHILGHIKQYKLPHSNHPHHIHTMNMIFPTITYMSYIHYQKKANLSVFIKLICQDGKVLVTLQQNCGPIDGKIVLDCGLFCSVQLEPCEGCRSVALISETAERYKAIILLTLCMYG